MSTNALTITEVINQIHEFNGKSVLTKKKPEMDDFLGSIDDLRLTFSMVITDGICQELAREHSRDLETFLHAILAFERQFGLFQREGPKGPTLDNMHRLKDVEIYRDQIIALRTSYERWQEVRNKMRH